MIATVFPNPPNYVNGLLLVAIAQHSDTGQESAVEYLFNASLSFLICFTAVYGVDPDLTREGGSIPVTLAFQEATEKSVMLLPLGSSDDGAHSQNEKMNRWAKPEGAIHYNV